MSTARWQQYLPRMATPARVTLTLVLLAWLAWWLADSFWLFSSGPSAPLPQRDLPLLSVAGDDNRQRLGLEQIRRWQVFGEAGARPAQQTAEAPDTRLQLELVGLFQSDAEQAGAIIAEKGRDGELYRVGARIPGNATLEEIHADRVILLRAGQREALRLKEPEISGVSAPSAVLKARPPAGLLRRREEQAQQQAPTDMAEIIGDDDLAAQRDMIVQQLGMTPSEGGGYQVGAGAPQAVMRQIGMRPGDVVVSVNGITLGDESSDMAALESFRSSGAASIVVQRGAQRFTVNYPP